MADAFQSLVTAQSTAQATQSRSRGMFYNAALGIRFVFQYNPKDITDTKPIDWQTQGVLGTVHPLITYGSGGLRTMKFEILLDAHASPRDAGEIENDLFVLRTLGTPFDVDGKPVVKIPKAPPSGQALMSMATGSQTISLSNSAPEGPGRVSGVPPMVKIVLGSRIIRGLPQNIEIVEELHGTTPSAKAGNYCTRATVRFDFIVVEDTRMLVHWSRQQP